MAETGIAYFLEDRAQESFIRALVEKVATLESVTSLGLKHYLLSSTGGSRAIMDFRNFANEARKGKLPGDILRAELIVVAIDGNCKGVSQMAEKLNRHVRADNRFSGKVVYAIPDPHIERWYLLDPQALLSTIGQSTPPPQYKCSRDYYKAVLRRLLQDAGIPSLLGGAELGKPIVDQMDLYHAAQVDPSFDRFVRDLRSAFRRLKGS